MPAQAFDSAIFLKNLTEKPGIYQMLDEQGDIIYVGKAKNLKKRVASYFQKQDHSPKTLVMISLIQQIQVIVTHSEYEALLLECHLIKKHLPRYNVIFRDDKSYPSIFLSADDFPRLSIYRGKQTESGDYFGPFTGSNAANYSISLMQKLFRIRQCENSVFNYRSRPCLQYQIKRCSGPCVGLISAEDYQQDVDLVRLFYRGKNDAVVKLLSERMQRAAEQLRFEEAAQIRDQIILLRRVLEKQTVQANDINIDVIAACQAEKIAGIFILHVRHGLVQGSRQFFPQVPDGTLEPEMLESFIGHFYIASQNELPMEIIASHPVADEQSLVELLGQIRGSKVRLAYQVKTNRAAWLAMAKRNLKEMLATRLASRNHSQKRLSSLMDALSLDKLPLRMECFDISHFQGEQTVASCVVFEQGQAKKSDYRRFNIKEVNPGDDYAAIEQAVRRRFQRLVKEDARLPDLLLIDGGKGQLNQAQKVLDDLGLNEVALIGVAKGADRKVGMEQIFLPNQAMALRLDEDSPGLHLIQAIRDEAHRFAITGHRSQRDKKRKTSTLETIDGIGGKRRKALLQHFGGLQEVKRASVSELMQVEGINEKLAVLIYNQLHL